MRKYHARFVATVLSLSLLSACAAGGPTSTTDTPKQEPLKIGWSLWPGWMPWAIVSELKLLEKHGANAELVFFPNYLDTQTAFTSKQLDLTHLTINDALVPMSKGTDAKVIVVNDVSNGGDGVIARDPIRTIADLEGKTVSLELGSVSHFLLLKALEKADVDPATVQINNMPADLAGTSFIGNAKAGPVVTWNPFLSNAKKSGANLLFDSSKIYGQICDLTLVQGDVLRDRRADVEAVVAAWFDALAYINDPTTHEEAIAIMAKGSNVTSAEFEALLVETELFMTPDRTLAFFGTSAKPGAIVGYAQEVNDFLLEEKFIDRAVDVGNLFDASVIEAVVDSSGH